MQQLNISIMKKLFSTRYSELSFNLSMFLIRLGFGIIIFLNHGMMKLNNYSQLKESFSDPLHVGHSGSLMIAIFAEIFCSALLVLGLLTRLAALVLAILLLTVVFVIRKNKPFLDSELPILYLIGFLTVLFCGPGKWSMDRWIGK